jgi:hypothetical protein
MTESATQPKAPLPRFKERLLDNGVVERIVRVTKGDYRGRLLSFKKHSADRYTVFGLSPLPYEGISIERRKYEQEVLLEDSGVLYPLRPEHLWIAHSIRQRSYYGVLGVGATPEEAYANTFDWRRPSWPA